MKHLFSILAIALIALSFASCQKVRTNKQGTESVIVNESYEAQINNNESYEFHLPNNEFIITEDALNAQISMIDAENNIYNYTPNANFVGTETIKLSSQNYTGFCGTPDVNNSTCSKNKREQKTHYNYQININVTAITK
jgi:hypothetical protein